MSKQGRLVCTCHATVFCIQCVMYMYMSGFLSLQACMLLNNLHALRVHTQGLFEDMGGEEVGHRGIYIVPLSRAYLHCVMYTCVLCTRGGWT